MRFAHIMFFLCSLQFATSQKNNSLKIKNSYQNYFEFPRESIYLHLNKTTYLAGEKIWFTAYVYDRKTGLPFLDTTNLICGLYNAEGEQVNKKLFYAENGIASGHFEVKSSLKKGDFYIKASTNYLKNFKEENGFVQKVKIIGSEKIINSSLSSAPEFDVQFLPEAGHIVSGIKNTIGFKITNPQATNTTISNASLIDSKNQIVLSNINSNMFGIGKFSFKQNVNETYFLHFKLADGSQIARELPNSTKKGIALTVNNLFNNKIAIELRTNSETLPSVENEDLYLAIHRDGLLTLNTFKLNALEKSIYISKDKLLPGINIITLFNADLKPILERLIFNETNIKIGQITANIEKKNSQDSVRIKLNLFSKNNTPTNISISVLPEETISNEKNRSIISDFLLKPYIRSKVENAEYYFKNITRKKRFELDMLLLTQGWSRYDWEDIFKKSPQKKYGFEKGIEITGKALNATYNEQNTLLLYGNKIEESRFADVERSKNFAFTNTIVFKGDSLLVSLINKKGKTEKPKLLDITFSPILNKGTLPFKTISSPEIIPNNSEDLEKKVNLEMVYSDNTIALNNVTVTEKKIDKKLTHKPSLLFGVYEGVKITPKDVKTTPILAQLIMSLGFRVIYNAANGSSMILSKKTRPDVVPPKVMLDDFVIFDYVRGINNVPENLMTSSTNMIDEVYYEHFGMEGSNGGTIYIYRRYGSSVTDQQKKNFAKMLATEGFQRPTEYFNPKYSSYNSDDFLKYGVVHWENRLSTKTTGSTEFNIPNFGLKNVKLFIEGMSEDGTLFSDVQTIYLN